jgi:6-pyruvoyltetrahydropterin/6-carboxytetrahydropterin synthase
MIIRKLFRFEGSHVVRNATTQRCATSIHGHSFVVEVFLSGRGLDRGGMVVDFSLLKPYVGTLIDSFDHSHSFWSKESDQTKQLIKTLSNRWVELPVSPSAENYALLFLYIIDKIITNTQYANGEQSPYVTSVRVHETQTGYAEAFREDLDLVDYTLDDIIFSNQIEIEWGSQGYWWNDLKLSEPWVMSEPPQQCS